MATRKRTDPILPRWHVAMGGYPDGWNTPFLMTNDPYAAMTAYENAYCGHMQTVAIFDDRCGEGQPLSPATVEEILDNEYEKTVDLQGV